MRSKSKVVTTHKVFNQPGVVIKEYLEPTGLFTAIAEGGMFIESRKALYTEQYKIVGTAYNEPRVLSDARYEFRLYIGDDDATVTQEELIITKVDI